MPQFYPEHTPDGLDDFTKGYLDCAEWLIPEPSNDCPNITTREKIRGWTKKAIARAKRDCMDFQKAYAADLALYEEITGRDMRSAGHDFWLTRNRHGAGFWDRGAGEAGKRLTEMSRPYGDCDVDPYKGWLHLT